MRFKGFIHDTRGWGQRFFQGGQSGMNSLLAPGLHPFSPHFSPQKSGKPETFSVNLQTVEEKNWENFVRRHIYSCLGDLSGLLSALIPRLIMEDDDCLRLVLKWRLQLRLIALLSKNLQPANFSPPSKGKRQWLTKEKCARYKTYWSSIEALHFWSWICKYSPLSVESPFLVVAAFPIAPSLPLSTRYKV